MIRTRVIFNTCVVVSGFCPDPKIQPQCARDLMSRWAAGKLKGVVSQRLVADYEQVLPRDESRLGDMDVSAALALARKSKDTEYHIVPDDPLPRVAKDAKYDHLFMLAKMTRANYLCAENVEGLLDLHLYGDTVLASPEVLHGAEAMREQIAEAARLGAPVRS
jgi:predicted nucleic acid-binding protein